MTMLDDIQAARGELYALADITISASSRYVVDHGIARAELEAHAGTLVIAKGEMLPGNRFDFSTSGQALAMIEVLAAYDTTTIDLVAWPADGSPALFGTLLGEADLLGAARLGNAATYTGGQPIQLFKTPLGWLQAGCQGAVILDPVAAVGVIAEALDEDAGRRISGENVAHTRRLARLLKPYVDHRQIVTPLPAVRQEAA